MKTASKQAAQGDVLFTRIRALPSKASAVKATGRHIVAHSETGHHHTVDPVSAEMFEEPGDPMTCYLRMTGTECLVTHERSFDTHDTIALLGNPGTVWEVRRQEEWTPEGWRRVED